MAEFDKCPQCGKDVSVITTELIFYKLFARHGESCISVECQNLRGCGLKMNFHTDIADYDGELEKLALRWNRISHG